MDAPDTAIRAFFPNVLAIDFFSLMCGEVLGHGRARTVYASKLDPTLVIKFEDGSGDFENIMEWETWSELSEYRPAAKWLAPCVDISPCGSVLLMRRTTPLSPDQYPKRIPNFLTDMKYTNFGMLDGRLVCHDYGRTLLMSKGASPKTRVAKWWGEPE